MEKPVATPKLELKVVQEVRSRASQETLTVMKLLAPGRRQVGR